jgi:IMP dehydrogenase
MQKHKVGKLPIVNEDNELVALICRGDLKKQNAYPNASRDANRQLLVGACCGCRDEADWNRATALIEAGVDVVMLDTDDAVDEMTQRFIERFKDEYKTTDIIAGKVTSYQQAKVLLDAGVDALRIGAQSRSCRASTLFDVSRLSRGLYGIPVMADMGVSDCGELLKALALGAHTVCLDELLAGTEEAPGDYIYRDGARLRLRGWPGEGDAPYPGAGPQVSQQGTLIDKGSVQVLLPHIMRGVRKGLRAIGLKSVMDIHKALSGGLLRMERQLGGGPCWYKEHSKPTRPMVSALQNVW